MNINKVIDVLNQQPAKNINLMIRRRIMEKTNPEKSKQLTENITNQIRQYILSKKKEE
jgi:hypothetical protein